MPKTSRVRALRLIEWRGLSRPRELEACGVSRAQLSRLVNKEAPQRGHNDLARFARICRVSRVVQPYLDAIA